MCDVSYRNLFIVNIAFVVTEYWFCCKINVSDLIKEITKSCVQSKKYKKISGGHK